MPITAPLPHIPVHAIEAPGIRGLQPHRSRRSTFKPGVVSNVRRVVARLYNPQRERTYQQLDLDYVCGTRLVAERLLDRVQAGHGHHVDSFGDVEIVVFRLRDDAAGKHVSDIFVEAQVLPAIIARGNRTFIPTMDTELQVGDIMRVAVKNEAVHKLARFMEE